MEKLEERLLSRDMATVLKAVELVSHLALESEESNTRLSNSRKLLVALVQLIDAANLRLSAAAINAVMDLGITSLARQALVECDLGRQLVSLFRWFAESLASSRRTKDMHELLELSAAAVEKLFLDHTASVPDGFFLDVYRYVKTLWLKNRLELEKQTGKCLARLLARLGMEQVDVISQKELSSTPTLIDFSEHFLEKHWEKSPWTGKVTSQLLEQFFPARGQPSEELLRALVEKTVTCPPTSNDELSSSEVFQEIQESLGDGIKYQQDIRLVKCSGCSEEHYAHHAEEQVINTEEVLKAFELGYTVAVRGMEFRSPAVAAVSEYLGLQIGQVSVGANFYMTPPKSQGLALHYDDHCVFVVQVAGQKKWSIYPPEHALPRLYERRSVPQGTGTPTDVLLSEGDTLYIPRGFPHRAVASGGKRKPGELVTSSSDYCCMSDATATSNTGVFFSLHLTFGVEVEAPFSWEGFVHIALHRWTLRSWKCDTNEERACKLMLHFAVKSVGDKAQNFRKACLVAIPSTDEPANLKMFVNLIQSLELNSGFIDACKLMSNEQESLDWLKNIHTDGSSGFYDQLDLALGTVGNPEVGETFTALASQFVNQATSERQVYDEARQGFLSLLQRYRASRRKTLNAMLALH